MAFDTERAARRLADAGMEERAANGVADVMVDATSGLATEARMNAGFAALREDMARLAGRMETGFAEMRADIAESRAEAAEFRADIYRALWIQGLGILAGTAAIVTIIIALD